MTPSKYTIAQNPKQRSVKKRTKQVIQMARGTKEGKKKYATDIINLTGLHPRP